MSDKVKIHHFGIAVKDLGSMQALLENIFNIRFSMPEEVESQGVKVAFAEFGEASLELIEATSSQSPLFPLMKHPIRNFLKKHGEGLHHICFEVDNIEKYLLHLKEIGIDSLGSEIMLGSGAARVKFLNPNDCHGLLIELREESHE